MKTDTSPTIECHPPERRRRTEIRMCHGSCCCCCCCLHTVGGIVGAAIAPKLGGAGPSWRQDAWSHLSLIDYWDEDAGRPALGTGVQESDDAISKRRPGAQARPAIPDSAVPDLATAGVSAVKVFWRLSALAVAIGLILGVVQGGGGTGFVIGLVILALVFPAIQLASAIITMIWLMMSSRPDRSFQLKQIGKVTLGVFVGAVAGILSMVGIWAILK